MQYAMVELEGEIRNAQSQTYSREQSTALCVAAEMLHLMKYVEENLRK